jgi:hypothetical protein
MKIKKDYDVIVIGGGPGGFSAAIASARKNASTLLIERYGFLGGMATAGLVNPFMSYKLKNQNLTTSVFNELIKCLEEEGGLSPNKHIFDDEIMKIVLDQLMAKYGVNVLLHSLFAGLECEKGKIKTIYVEGKSGRIALHAKIFIDATGDGDVAAKAGAEIQIGRAEDGLCQPMTLCFRIGGISGNPDIHELRKELNEIFLKAKEKGEINQPRENVLVFSTLVPHIFHFNTTRIVGKSGIDVFQLTESEIEGRRQTMELFKLFKKYSPRFKDAYLIKMACQIGVRETRRIMGLYVLNEQDVLEARKFLDGIAKSNYPVDIHNPAGSGTVIKHVKTDDYYEIPYRCLVPKNINNLLIGSRCISSTHEAHSSLRIMPVVSGIGEAAGIASAIAVENNIPPSEIDGHKIKEEIFTHV